jgi:pantoate--beta-alanine ligase
MMKMMMATAPLMFGSAPHHATNSKTTLELVYVAFGSNVGDRESYVHAALEGLSASIGIEVLRVSSMRETAFEGEGPEQGPFLNGVIELKTSLSGVALMAVLQGLEKLAGRQFPHPVNHPRELDLDIILYGDKKIDSRELVVPHPRACDRSFVIEPLRELGVDVDSRLPRVGSRCVSDGELLTGVVSEWLAGDCTIGLVPTMGSLHEGHASLMRAARRECDRVLVSVFVNPLQFGQGEDFDAYPRNLEADLSVCDEVGVDVVFAPPAGQMFGEGFSSHVAVGSEAEGLEGALRPGHFGGVATVVARLFAMMRPHRAYFGSKDAQQVAVIQRMTKDLGFPVCVVACPIVRESDGLAMSSRNVYLSDEDRVASTVIYRAMVSARDHYQKGLRDRDQLLGRVAAVLASEPRCDVDYIDLRREGDLAEVAPGEVVGGRLLVAAKFSGGDRVVRLLDNLSLASEDEHS